MSKCVLDASVILAVLLQETGYEAITPAIRANSAASSVSMAEVQTRLVRSGVPPDQAWNDALPAVRETIAFDDDQARIAGTLALQTKTLGLSLGDRACLALALSLKVPVYTADRSWKKLSVGIPVHVIR